MLKLAQPVLVSVDELVGQLGSKRFPAFIEACEQNFTKQIEVVSEAVMNNPKLKLIFLSGPTSSGKTTFSTHFTAGLTAKGRRCHLISMDDYYYEGAIRYDEVGRPDFESVETLELKLLLSDLQALLDGQCASIPCFDFASRTRTYPEEKRLCMAADDLIMIEGLHGLSPEVMGGLAREKVLAVFIMPEGSLISDERLLDATDVRILRRASRDVVHRGSSALATIDYWPMITKAEQDFVPQYLERADFFVNSLLPYEFCVTAPAARRELERSIKEYIDGELAPSPNVRKGLFYADLNHAIKEARRLQKACLNIPAVSAELVPAHSILKEFIA